MGSGNCKNCEARMTGDEETIACECCGAPICEACITSGEAYESPVDGATYCKACVSDLPSTLAKLARVRTEGQGRVLPQLVIADLRGRDRMLDVYGDDYGTRPGEGGIGDYQGGDDDRPRWEE